MATYRSILFNGITPDKRRNLQRLKSGGTKLSGIQEYALNQSGGSKKTPSKGGGGGSKPSKSGSLSDQLMADWKKQMDAANAANKKLRGQIEGGWADAERDALAAVEGRYDQARTDADTRAFGTRSRNKSALARTGLYNSTNQVSLDRHVDQDLSAEHRRIAATEAGERAGIIQNSRHGLLNFQNSIQQSGPNGNMMAQLLQQYGKGIGGQEGLDGYAGAIGGEAMAPGGTSGGLNAASGGWNPQSVGAKIDRDYDYMHQFSSRKAAPKSTKPVKKNLSFKEIMAKNRKAKAARTTQNIDPEFDQTGNIDVGDLSNRYVGGMAPGLGSSLLGNMIPTSPVKAVEPRPSIHSGPPPVWQHNNVPKRTKTPDKYGNYLTTL